MLNHELFNSIVALIKLCGQTQKNANLLSTHTYKDYVITESKEGIWLNIKNTDVLYLIYYDQPLTIYKAIKSTGNPTTVLLEVFNDLNKDL